MAKGKKKITPVTNKSNLIVNATLVRQNLIRQLIDMEGRSINQECGYPDAITANLYRELYDREGIATRVVACMPEESWSSDPEIYETEESEETVFESVISDLTDNMNIFHYLHRIDELSGIGRFGILLLGIDDGSPLDQPIEGLEESPQYDPDEKEKVEKGHRLLYLRPFDESCVTIVKRETNRMCPRYGLPVMYTVSFNEEDISGGQFSANVHWHRVIHVADRRQMSETYGTPRMEPVYNRLLDIRKVLSSSGEMYWRGAFPGISFEVSPEAIEQGATLDPVAMREEFEKYTNGLQRYLAVQGVSAKTLMPTVVDPTGNVEAQLKSIAISLSVPYRILFGSEQAQLASEQDAQNWGRRVKKRQEKYISPMIIRPFIDRCITLGILPEVEDYKVQWPDYALPTEEGRANVAKTRTEAISTYIAGGVDQIIPPKSFLIQVLGMSVEEAETLLEEAEEYADAKAEEHQHGIDSEEDGNEITAEPDTRTMADFPPKPKEEEPKEDEPNQMVRQLSKSIRRAKRSLNKKKK